MPSQPSSPALSVAMSVYNGERFLAPAIESVLAQDFSDFEFLILDDGSTDATPGMIRDFAARDSRIRAIIRENRGLVASLNQLLAEAQSPLVARMDADDICRPNRFTRQIAFLAANPDHGVIGSWSEDIDTAGRPWQADGPDHPPTHEELVHNIFHGGPLMVHPSVMYRKAVVEAVGGYHAAFRHCEDFDLWLRLASVTRMANIPERLIRYRHYPEQVSKKYAVEQSFGSAVARLAHAEREAGRPDPTEDLTALPPLGELDALFGRAGVDRAVANMTARGVLYSPTALRTDGFPLVLELARSGEDRGELWRTVLRLLRFGAPVRAAKLAATLARAA